MKKILLTLLAVLMASLAAHADVTINSTNFPDANFRSYLLSIPAVPSPRRSSMPATRCTCITRASLT